MRKPLLRMERTDDYDAIVKFLIDNDLEFGDEEEDSDPHPAEVLRCWQVLHGEEKHMCAACVLAKKEGKFIIDGIAVEKIYRGMGIGKILMNKAVETVREMGGTELYLNAREPGFYFALGFKEADKDLAPHFYECMNCPQYGRGCDPKIMVLEV